VNGLPRGHSGKELTKDYIFQRSAIDKQGRTCNGSTCWIWTLHLNKGGYGQAVVGGRNYLAHRLAYMIFNGPIMEQTLDHLCRVRACVNPDHLEPVSHRKNMERGRWATATTCIYGHPRNDDNTKIEMRRSGKVRRCLECKRLGSVEYRKRLSLRLGNDKTRNKLNPEAVKVIRHLFRRKQNVVLAGLYRVTPSVITEVAKREIWRHV
jgi:hypothetical protein